MSGWCGHAADFCCENVISAHADPMLSGGAERIDDLRLVAWSESS
jgi:hypothetical protein